MRYDALTPFDGSRSRVPCLPQCSHNLLCYDSPYCYDSAKHVVVVIVSRSFRRFGRYGSKSTDFSPNRRARRLRIYTTRPLDVNHRPNSARATIPINKPSVTLLLRRSRRHFVVYIFSSYDVTNPACFAQL